METLSTKAQNLKNNATIIGKVAGVTYYESPSMGDESPLLIIWNGKAKKTYFWELPSLEEHIDYLDELEIN
jgi:hypothetical protein